MECRCEFEKGEAQKDWTKGLCRERGRKLNMTSGNRWGNSILPDTQTQWVRIAPIGGGADVGWNNCAGKQYRNQQKTHQKENKSRGMPSGLGNLTTPVSPRTKSEKKSKKSLEAWEGKPEVKTKKKALLKETRGRVSRTTTHGKGETWHHPQKGGSEREPQSNSGEIPADWRGRKKNESIRNAGANWKTTKGEDNIKARRPLKKKKGQPTILNEAEKEDFRTHGPGGRENQGRTSGPKEMKTKQKYLTPEGGAQNWYQGLQVEGGRKMA